MEDHGLWTLLQIRRGASPMPSDMDRSAPAKYQKLIFPSFRGIHRGNSPALRRALGHPRARPPQARTGARDLRTETRRRAAGPRSETGRPGTSTLPFHAVWVSNDS